MSTAVLDKAPSKASRNGTSQFKIVSKPQEIPTVPRAPIAAELLASRKVPSVIAPPTHLVVRPVAATASPGLCPVPIGNAATARPIAPSPSTRLDPAEQKGRERALLETGYFALSLQGALGLGDAVGMEAIFEHLADLRTSQVWSDDPVEAMLLEKVYFLHLRGARLHARAEELSESADAAVRFSLAACRVDAEMTKCVEALAAYRLSPRRPAPRKTGGKKGRRNDK